jgi:hypothetical protein
MENEARMDSLMSDQESEKVEIYFTARRLPAEAVFLEVYLQETNQPRKKVLSTKPSSVHNQLWDFPESLVLDYYFESTPPATQSARSSSSRSSHRSGSRWARPKPRSARSTTPVPRAQRKTSSRAVPNAAASPSAGRRWNGAAVGTWSSPW